MGYMSHHAIVVVGTYEDHAAKARARAGQLGMAVSELVRSPVNGVDSFMVAPDGSTEGWGESDLGDRQRREFLEYLESIRYEDGSSPLRWALVEMPEDRIAKVSRCDRSKR